MTTENLNEPQKLQININSISSTTNGYKSNVYISDDLGDLKKKYTFKQLKKIWKDANLIPLKIFKKVIITKLNRNGN